MTTVLQHSQVNPTKYRFLPIKNWKRTCVTLICSISAKNYFIWSTTNIDNKKSNLYIPSTYRHYRHPIPTLLLVFYKLSSTTLLAWPHFLIKLLEQSQTNIGYTTVRESAFHLSRHTDIQFPPYYWHFINCHLLLY
jgi:hypothetical protein